MRKSVSVYGNEKGNGILGKLEEYEESLEGQGKILEKHQEEKSEIKRQLKFLNSTCGWIPCGNSRKDIHGY